MANNSTNPLLKEVVSRNLKTLAYHPILLQHTFVELSVANLDLDDIECLENFLNVMYLNVSSNRLSTLKVLSKLVTLSHLDASQNQLTSCVDFYPPHCNQEHAWQSGHLAAGSMLTLLNLSKNIINEIRDVHRHQFLECLLLGNNQIARIEGLNTLRYLKTLDISNNAITVIEGLDHLPITELNLANNRIKTLGGLSNLPHLCSLNVAGNEITSLAPLSSIATLSYLDVRNNQLEHIRQTEFLREIPWLNVLLMSGNPCAKKEHYRLRVLYRLPALKRVDLSNASAEEKIRACNLYQAPGGDFELRERVHQRYIPDEPFVDHCSAQLPYDDEVEVPFEVLISGQVVAAPAGAVFVPSSRGDSFNDSVVSDARQAIVA